MPGLAWAQGGLQETLRAAGSAASALTVDGRSPHLAWPWPVSCRRRTGWFKEALPGPAAPGEPAQSPAGSAAPAAPSPEATPFRPPRPRGARRPRPGGQRADNDCTGTARPPGPAARTTK